MPLEILNDNALMIDGTILNMIDSDIYNTKQAEYSLMQEGYDNLELVDIVSKDFGPSSDI